MKLAQLLSNERTFGIDFDGDILNVTYCPSDLTPELEDKFQTSFETNRQGGALAKYLCGVITEWDLEDDNGEPFPLTIEKLNTLPIEFIGKVANAIIEDANPKKESAETSLGGSRRKAR